MSNPVVTWENYLALGGQCSKELALRTQTEAILQDLIAELRAINGDSAEAEYSVDVLADRAEARLREVQDDQG